MKLSPSRHHGGGILLLSLLTLTPATQVLAGPGPAYVAKELTGLQAGTRTEAWGINDNGDVVGNSEVTTTSGLIAHATRWPSGTLSGQDIGAPSAGSASTDSSSARSINNLGQIVGYFGPLGVTPAYWNPGALGYTPMPMGTGRPGDSWLALAVNDKGQIAGYRDSAVLSQQFASYWTNPTTSPTALTPLSTSPNGRAYGINNTGLAAGSANITSSTVHAAAWNVSTAVASDLGTLPGGLHSTAKGVNTAGTVVGWSSISSPSTAQHPVMWKNGTITDLGLASGDDVGYANDINDSDTIVGYSNLSNSTSLTSQRAVVWYNGAPGPVDLNAMVALPGGAKLKEATAINNNGQIIANGTDNKAYLLTPVSGSTSVPLASGPLAYLLAGLIWRFSRRRS